jgi:hypothetical protein
MKLKKDINNNLEYCSNIFDKFKETDPDTDEYIIPGHTFLNLCIYNDYINDSYNTYYSKTGLY